MRAMKLLLPFLLATTLSATTAADEAQPPPETEKVDDNRRVIQSIELFTKKKSRFNGRVVVGFANKEGGWLTYYWGGKCKKAVVTNARVSLLYRVMRDKMTIEIPGRPIRVKDSVYMCMSSIRILARRS